MNNTMLLYAHLTDKELLDSVDNAARKNCYEVLIRRHSAALFRIARMYGFSHSDAEDLVQCTHTEAYKQRTRFSPTVSYRTWLTKIMINNCLHARNGKIKEAGDTVAEPSCSPVRSDQHFDSERLSTVRLTTNRLEACLEQLSLPLKSVYILTEIDGYSLAEAAYLLSTSEDNIKLRLDRAKSSLRKSQRKLHRLSDVYPLDAHSIDRIVSEVMRKIDSKVDLPLGVPTY